MLSDINIYYKRRKFRMNTRRSTYSYVRRRRDSYYNYQPGPVPGKKKIWLHTFTVLRHAVVNVIMSDECWSRAMHASSAGYVKKEYE